MMTDRRKKLDPEAIRNIFAPLNGPRRHDGDRGGPGSEGRTPDPEAEQEQDDDPPPQR